MGDRPVCARCAAPLTDPSVRACEHLATMPLVSAEHDERCLHCHELPAERLAPLCPGCAAEQLALRVDVSEADAHRGWTIASHEAVVRFRQRPLHPLPSPRLDCWAKLTFVTVPHRAPRHIESMWIRITGHDDDRWHGTVDNQPEVVDGLALGDPISFTDDQVTAVTFDTASRELPPDHACAICEPGLRAATQQLDAGDESLLDATRRFGFMVLRIDADATGPAFAFTVGLAHRFDHPELICFGADAESLGEIVRDLANQVVAGTRFTAGELRHDLFHHAAARFEPLTTEHDGHHREYLGYACWFHQRSDFPALQVVWSDRSGRFPEDPEFDAALTRWQEQLNR